jgi:hypothetical protein
VLTYADKIQIDKKIPGASVPLVQWRSPHLRTLGVLRAREGDICG